MGVPVALLVAAGAWVGVQAALGARDLRRAAAELTALSDLSAASRAGSRLETPASLVRGARERFEDPLVRTAAGIPWLGTPLATATGLAVAADTTLRGALLPLAGAAGDDPGRRLLPGAGVVDVAYLSGLAGPSAEALSSLAAAEAALEATPAGDLVPAVSRARVDFLAALQRLRRAVSALATTTAVAPTLLGVDAPKHYLLVPQNPAEARGTGGLVGGWMTLTADAGIVRVTGSGPSTSLTHFSSGERVLDLGPEFRRNYGHNEPTAAWVNSNLSPHYPYAASIWAALWKAQTGQQVDGVLAVDPVALSHLLRATGPVTVSDGTSVTAGNVVELTLRDAYRQFDDRGARKQYLQEVAVSVAERLLSAGAPPSAVIDGLSRSVEERRLLLWSRDADVAQALAGRSIAGELPQEGAVVGDVVVNANGSKLDYYLDRSLTYSPGCSGGLSTVTLVMRNDAPVSGLPDHVTTGTYRGAAAAGTNRATVTIYLPAGSRRASMTLGSTPVPHLSGQERGLPWVQTTLEVPPQQERRVAVQFVQTFGAAADVTPISQPLVRPERFTSVRCS